MKLTSDITYERIKESLKTLNYDPNKHKNLKACLFEILSKDEYDKVMRGIITNSEHLEEVRNILEAYEFLKENETEMMFVINEMTSELLNVEEVYDEVFFYYDEEDSYYHIMKKDRQTGKYVEIQTSLFVSINDNFYVIKDGQDKILCNFQGDYLKVIDSKTSDGKEKFIKVTNQIISIRSFDKQKSKKNICYIKLEKTKNNSFKQLDNPDKLIVEILSSNQVDSINKNYIFDLVWAGKSISYGNMKKKKIEIINNYVYVVSQNGQISYYTLDGKQIISTDNDNYFYIGFLVPDRENKKNIVVVGKYNNKLEKMYNYYDLDNRHELFKQNFSFAYNWTNYGAVVRTPELAIVRKNKKIIPCDSKNVFPVINSPINKEKQMIAHNIKKWKENIHIVEFVDFDPNELSYFDEHNLKIDDISYNEDDNMCEQISYWEYQHTKVYALIKDIFTSPQMIGNYFVEYRMFDEKSDRLYVVPALYKKCLDRFNFRLLDINGNEMDIIRLPDKNNKKITSSISNNNSSEIKMLLNGSAFLLPSYSVNQKNELENLKKELIEHNNLNMEVYRNNCDNFSYSWFKGPYPEILIRQVKYISKNNTAVVEVNDCKRYAYDRYRQNYNVVVNRFGELIYFDKATPISMDKLGNTIMSVPYGDSSRVILVNSEGEILIEFATDIITNNSGLYIVCNNDKYQLYDSNGIVMTPPADKQEWVKKYYINNCGVICDIQDRLMVTNSGYKYLVDDDGDITIKENVEHSKMLQKIMYFDKKGVSKR